MHDKNLILPVGGQSSRFPNMRPKYLLTHPSGCFMLTESIRGIAPTSFDKIIIIALQEHQEQYKFAEGLYSELFEQYELGQDKVTIVFLEKATKSQAETVMKGIELSCLTGSMLIKDCDNFFEIEANSYGNKNFIAVGDLHQEVEITPGNKSYVVIGENGTIQNIVEKEIISNRFCAGGYYFSDSKEFIKAYEKVKELDNLFVSHVIYQMLIDNQIFFTQSITKYVDWGTIADWNKYISEFSTIFIDLDGVLVGNSAQHFDPKWGSTKGIIRNIEFMNNLYNKGKTRIIITTSRSEAFREKTLDQLKANGILFHDLCMGLPHGKRILINDYSATNPFPTAIAVNLKRDDYSLGDILGSQLKIR